MFKHRDLILIACVLAVAAALWGVRALNARGKAAQSVLRVYVNGAPYASVPLRAGEAITVEQPDGAVNVLRMTQDGFYMESSTCHNQLCVLEGHVTRDNWPMRALGAHIICLPNRVDAELVLSGQETDAWDPEAPDV